MIKLVPPVVQIALDYPTIEEALEMARIGVEAGVDWLEIGTPLITCQGLDPIGAMARSFPDHPVLADYKTMDSGFKNVERTHAQGGHIMTVCANAPDETVQSAAARGREMGIYVVTDTIGVKDQGARARQCEAWGVDMIYLHYGADQWRADATQDSTQWIDEVRQAVSLPIGVGTFGVEDAVRAVRKGVEAVTIGHPLLGADDPLRALREYVQEVKANHRPRGS
ncbi:MAG: hypothetical protein CMJ18_13165 [Phycisphaeraceae bacterium]|nr:hypothetical protein [Phycisphaeraceae bacterium]